MLMLTGQLVGGLQVDFLNALLASIIISVVSTVLSWFLIARNDR
jgi:uncharacterized membrane protein YvlD (DUF360 family)